MGRAPNSTVVHAITTPVAGGDGPRFDDPVQSTLEHNSAAQYR